MRAGEGVIRRIGVVRPGRAVEDEPDRPDLLRGPGSRHELNRHPNAEEWEYVVAGAALKRIGDRLVRLEAGDVVFVPKGEYHSLENASATEPVVTIWGYSGAATLEQAGYLLPSDEPA
ncbi:cupin domain-containing protein [Microbacterium sp.]|uniref:cupin domain-containing protein n=1 Tax=Microbacterium sp. TaxID=51671 RepID=UPI0037C85929